MERFDVIVIGAGPAGLLAAGRAAERGHKVLLLEKMRQEGRKLLITGKGRCNITNDLPQSEFIKHVYPNGRFLKKAFSQFFSKDILHLLSDHGTEAVLERGGRYFPVSDQSKDVLQALLKWVKKNKVEIRCGHEVRRLIIADGSMNGVKVDDQQIMTNNVIIATGGKSYPATGSNGQGYDLAKNAGHTIINPRPALVPLETAGDLAQKLQGLNLKNVKAMVWVDGKKAGEDFGEMIFTHFGLSGPIILTLSRIVVDALKENKKAEISIDLKPALDDQKLDARLLRDLDAHGKKNIGNIFRDWLPASMATVFIDLLNIDPRKEGHQITANERKEIRKHMKNLSFNITNYRSFKEAIITAGGVSTNEINPKTMESKLVKGLFFAGEVIDVDAETGGFNLQIAYSTGWVAGNNAVKN